MKVKIRDIKAGMRGITVEGIVRFKSDVMYLRTKYGPAKFAYAIIEDDTGSIRLNLFRKQVDIVRVGRKIRVVNAFVKDQLMTTSELVDLVIFSLSDLLPFSLISLAKGSPAETTRPLARGDWKWPWASRFLRSFARRASELFRLVYPSNEPHRLFLALWRHRGDQNDMCYKIQLFRIKKKFFMLNCLMNTLLKCGMTQCNLSQGRGYFRLVSILKAP